MRKIILRKENVVKEVGSEEAANALERKGFIRDGVLPVEGKGAAAEKELADARAELWAASKYAEEADGKIDALTQELAETREQLKAASGHAEEAEKKVKLLTQELAGTKEQLEAAIKKNTAAEKKK